MPTYEIMTIAAVRAPAAHLSQLVKKVSVDALNAGGVIRGVDHLGLRPLAYRMRSHKKYHSIGRYFRVTVQASPHLLEHVTKTLRQDSNIVKYLVVKHKDIAPKQVFRPRQVFYEPIMDTGGYDLINRGSEMDLRVAAMLIERGLVSSEEIASLPTHKEVSKPLRGPTTANLLSKLRREYDREAQLSSEQLVLPPNLVAEGSTPQSADHVEQLFRERQFEKYEEMVEDESIILKHARTLGVDRPSAHRGAELSGVVGSSYSAHKAQAESVEQFLSMFREAQAEAGVTEDIPGAVEDEELLSSDRADIRKSKEGEEESKDDKP